MPQINLPPKKEKSNNHNETPQRNVRMEAYNRQIWRNLRKQHLMAHPLCQKCYEEGRVYAGTQEDPLQVHHIKSPFYTGGWNEELFLDPNNLETICSKHHSLEHHKQNGYEDPKDTISKLDELLKDEC